MKTLFSVGFQSNNPFTVRHPSLTGTPGLGRSIPLRQMGQASSEFEHVADAEAQANADLRAKLTTTIAAGNKHLAAVRAWINARINQDPDLVKSFGGDTVVASNFLSFNDMVTRDQSYADQAEQKAASDDPRNWDFSDSLLERVKEWSDGIDTLSAGIQQWGVTTPNKPPMVKVGAVSAQIVSPRTGIPVTSSIAPGSTLKTATVPSSGISNNTLLIGGIGAAAIIGIAYALTA